MVFLIRAAIGEVLGHDLMSPHTILSDRASTTLLEDPARPVWPTLKKKGASSPEDFSSYVDKLLAEVARDPDQGLLSPTEDDAKDTTAGEDDDSSTRDLINLAILRSNATTGSKQSTNRFEIKRNGLRVANIMLARPAFRLGETVSAVIDFQDVDFTCYALHSSLESWEVIDPTIALRSKASIHRATRKVYFSRHESTISACRVFFSPTIPSTAVPEFLTSGISLEWGLRFEFATKRMMEEDDEREAGGKEEDDDEELLEEVHRDERGTLRAAVQGLLCESFDVTVPIRVYGAVGPLDENSETADFRI